MSAESSEVLSQNSKIEIAKALLAVKSVATEEQFLAIRSMLVDAGSLDAVDRAITGLSEEAEFALMCRLMGTATHLVHLEQRPVIKGGISGARLSGQVPAWVHLGREKKLGLHRVSLLRRSKIHDEKHIPDWR